MTSRKQYLGDGVYADFDGYALVLTTSDGVSDTNEVVLEPSVMEALLRYAVTIWDRNQLHTVLDKETT